MNINPQPTKQITMTKAETKAAEMEKELKQIREYVNAMKKVGKAHSGDCDNLLIHLDNIDKYLSQLKPQEGKSKIKIGEYHLSKHNPISLTDQVLWITNKSGEGMGVDLDKLWKDNF